jgi:hypothetical protein
MLENMSNFNLHGDVPKEYLDLVEELQEMEEHFDLNPSFYGPAMVARMYTCIAHDYYDIGLEERGHELLLKADKACPDYFTDQIIKDVEGDSNFAYLVESLTANILSVIKSIAESR